RQGAAAHLGRTGPARAQQLADGAGELVVQSCDERQCGLREDGAEAGFERRVDLDVRHGLLLTRRSVLPGICGGAAWNLCAWRAGGPPGAVLGPGSDPDRGSCSRVCGVTARTDNANPVKTLTIRAESVVAEDVPGRRVPRPVGSAELSGFGGAFQCGGRRVRVDRGRDQVEVSGADLALMAGRGVSALLSGELALLQVDVGLHLLAGVAVSQIEHRVVERVEAGQGDELELVAHGSELALE